MIFSTLTYLYERKAWKEPDHTFTRYLVQHSLCTSSCIWILYYSSSVAVLIEIILYFRTDAFTVAIKKCDESFTASQIGSNVKEATLPDKIWDAVATIWKGMISSVLLIAIIALLQYDRVYDILQSAKLKTVLKCWWIKDFWIH